ncbi:hypothetical protein FHL15_009013 [Xylaria flabelliformis]|uniref:Ubiquitin-like domain-containing protein n=1 Tax=Xylaria flabelliformis TaxID=2512241 RepID=A0A553HQ55_9PEZI|nr:hypothetical protein FHL15_009013 [Xylaria flabelliformis]
MPVSFGFSVGDFIAVATLVHKIIQAIDENKGAATDYKSCVSMLRSLHSCICSIKNSLKLTQDASSFQFHEAALANGVMYEINICMDLLNAFLDSTYKYTASLLHSSEARNFEEAQTAMSLFRAGRATIKKLEKSWTKISWAIFRKEDIRKLELTLQPHLSALQLYEIALQRSSLCRVENCTAETALVVRRIEDTMMGFLDSLKSAYNTRPPHISDKINKFQPVFFEDALGRSIELPREFCVSKQRFQQHLEILFQDMPGYEKVIKKEYDLEDPAGTTIISNSDWHLKVTAGTRIAMTLLFQLTSRTKHLISQICPKCNTINRKSDLQQGMTKCSNCELIFVMINTGNGDARDLQVPWSKEMQESVAQGAFRRIRYYLKTEPVSASRTNYVNISEF